MLKKVEDLFIKALNRIPESIERILGGYSNESYRVVSKGEVFKVRIGGNNEFISRENELRILRLVGDKDCVYYEKDNGNSVWKWIEGDTAKIEDIDEGFLIKLVGIIDRLHSINVDPLILNHDDLEFLGETKRYLMDEDVSEYLRLLSVYKNDKRVFCHNDISLNNLIYERESGRLTLIDYEWGRINAPYWDFGNFIKESDVGEDLIVRIASIAGLDVKKLKDYVFISAFYSLQLSYMFKDSEGLIKYREKLNRRLMECREWLRE